MVDNLRAVCVLGRAMNLHNVPELGPDPILDAPAVQAALATAHSHFGRSLLIDCHSMPSHDQHDKPLADFVLGDLHHSTLDPAIGDLLAKIITETGYSLAWNHPFSSSPPRI